MFFWHFSEGTLNNAARHRPPQATRINRGNGRTLHTFALKSSETNPLIEGRHESQYWYGKSLVGVLPTQVTHLCRARACRNIRSPQASFNPTESPED